MARPLLPDGLWAEVAPLLPPERAKPKGGRPRTSDRAALTGILFVLRSGTPWELLPREMGCGSGMTCWRRLRDWQRAGVWGRLQHALLDRLGRQNGIDYSLASLNSALIAAKKGGRGGRYEANRSGQVWHEGLWPCRREGDLSRAEADGRQRA